MKRKLLIPSALLFTAASLPAALVAHYTLDNTAVSQVNSPAANGTVNGAAYSNTVVSPYPGSTHSLDLDQGVSNMTVSNSALAINGSYTAALWVNIDTMPTGGISGTIFGAYQTANPFQHNFLLRVTDTGLMNFIARDNDGSTVGINSGVLALDTWYHIAATFDAGTSTGTLYVNGLQVATAAMTGGTVAGFQNFAAPTFAGLGGMNNDTSRSMNGFVDDARLYNEVLSQPQIAALMVPEPSAALLGGLGVLALLRRRR